LSEKSPPADALSNEAISQRAYYLWEADGRPEGRSEHYWQMALTEAHMATTKADEKLPKKAATKPRASVASKAK
jgi:hypothetical protein